MPFVVKATYRNETRKFLFNDSHFPTYDELYHQVSLSLVVPHCNSPFTQLYRVFAIGNAYYLSKLLFSSQEGTRILIGMEARSVVEYDRYCAPFKGRTYPTGQLIFSVFDATPHKIPVPCSTGTSSFIHPIPPAQPIPFFAPPPLPPPPPPPPSLPSLPRDSHVPNPPHLFMSYDEWPPFPVHPGDVQPQLMNIDSESSTRQTASANTECCSVAQGKKEVRALMDTFLRDFTRIMGNTFGEVHSFSNELDTPTITHMKSSRGPSPLPAIDLDGSLHIPGSFIQPRPQSPSVMENGGDTEKGLISPQLEHLQALHPGVWCDFCGKQIRGLRFRCQECAEYDLVCVNCLALVSLTHRYAIVCKLHCRQPSTRQA